MGRFCNPVSAISLEGAGAGLNTATSWPRSASARAMGTRRVGKPRSFAGNMVNKNFAIESLPRIVYVYSQRSYKSNLGLCERPPVLIPTWLRGRITSIQISRSAPGALSTSL